MNSMNVVTTADAVCDSDVQALRASGEFDEQWYLEQYPDVVQTGVDPARHYLWIGRRLGRVPSAGGSSAARHASHTAPVGHGSLAIYETVWNEAFAVARGARSPSFAPRALTPVTKEAGAPLIAAFYLPQFHPFKENDEWWGTGFTEWTNVSKAVPQYNGHYQPRLPLDLGFYDLRNIEVMRSQVELARNNGIGAFCFHYYWFGGKRLLEKPLEAYLADAGETLDLPFFLCWANENWTRRWDGAESEILMEQSHSLEDHGQVFDDLTRFFADPRYVKIDGKPVIVVYRPGIIKNLDAMVDIWRQAAKAAGLPGIHLLATNAFGLSDPGGIGFDGLCEFPPHNVVAAERNNEKQWLNPPHEGLLYAYSEAVDYSINRLNDFDNTRSALNYYPTVMMGWDNEARKPGKSNIFDGCTPAEFHRWVDACLAFSKRNHTPGGGLVFVNAWNEWAEGTYLEPDRKFGHAYLWAVRTALEEHVSPAARATEMVRAANDMAGPRTADGVICLHLFYPDLIGGLAERINDLRRANVDLDVLISLPVTWDAETVRRALDEIRPKRTLLVKNRGRDVLPFLEVAREAAKMGYKYGCKIHSKKSPHVRGGNEWRDSIYSALLSPARAKAADEVFQSQPGCGLYAPASMVKSCDDPSVMRDNFQNVQRILAETGGSMRELKYFIAGTMFWFRFDAIKAALDSRFDEQWFGPELGAIDGTMAHAFERALLYLSQMSGYAFVEYSEQVVDPYA